MTISAADSQISYAGNGISTTFSVPFPFDTAADIKILSTDLHGNVTILVAGFTVTGGGGSTGTVRFAAAPASGVTITILDNPLFTQPTDYVSGAFPAESYERALDRVTRIAKRLEQKIQRCARTDDGDLAAGPFMLFPTVAARRGKFAMWADSSIAKLEPAVGLPIGTPLSQSIIGQFLNPQTQAEANAGLVPVNHAYPYGNALRHGFDRTGAADNSPKWTAALLAAYDGVELKFPAGTYRFNSAISTAKPYRTVLVGDRNPTYAFDDGTIFRFYGSGTGLTVGAEDGNPDSTGFTRDFYASDITFMSGDAATTTPAKAGVKIVNTALAVVERCKFRAFPEKQIWLRGGNVIVRVNENDIQGQTGAPGANCVGVYMDDYQFGSFVVHIERNHILGCNYAARFSEGRYLNFTRNTVENIVTHTYLFETAGYISHALFFKNYHETTKGYAFKGASFAGLILKLEMLSNEFWASGDGAAVNPGFGDFDANRVIERELRGNWIATAGRNTVAGLGLPAAYPDTNLFAIGTTVVRGEPENFEYEDALARQLRGTDLLGTAGDFCAVTATPEPFGWTDATVSGTWAATQTELVGGPVCNVPSADDSDMATKVISLIPAARTRYFAIGFTYKGWGAICVDTGSGYTMLFDAGSNVANYTTTVARFTVPVSAASFAVKISRNALNPIWVGEMRIFEIGSADYNNPGPGSLGSAMVNAVRRNMVKGAR